MTVSAFRHWSPLTIEKSAFPTSYSAVGQVITYTYNITNPEDLGFSEKFTENVTVTDNRTGQTTIPNNNLPPGQSITGTANYSITQADIDAGFVTNSASLSPDQSSNFTVYAVQHPALTIRKLAFPTSFTYVGQNITYIYIVTNTGNVHFTGNINVTDNMTETIPVSTSGVV